MTLLNRLREGISAKADIGFEIQKNNLTSPSLRHVILSDNDISRKPGNLVVPDAYGRLCRTDYSCHIKDTCSHI